MSDSYGMKDMCATCGECYGRHVGLTCAAKRGGVFVLAAAQLPPLGHPMVSKPPEPVTMIGQGGTTASDYWIGASTATSAPERRFPDYKDGIESERIRTRGVLEALAPRSTKIQRGMAESWKAEGAREQFDKMMKALGGCDV